MAATNNYCPNSECKQHLTKVIGHRIGIDLVGLASSDTTEAVTGITYKCPHCGTILGCQIDPIAIMGDIVEEPVKGLRKSMNPGAFGESLSS